MTEAEWMECADPAQMLEFLRGETSDRKLRLFAVACCRAILDLLPHQGSRQAIEVAERFADGLATEQEMRTAALRANGDAALTVEGLPVEEWEGCASMHAALVPVWACDTVRIALLRLG